MEKGRKFISTEILACKGDKSTGETPVFSMIIGEDGGIQGRAHFFKVFPLL
jgi:hypothetical protein